MPKKRRYTQKPKPQPKPKVKIRDQLKDYLRENPTQIPLVISAVANFIMMPSSLLLPVEDTNAWVTYFLMGMGASMTGMVIYEVAKKICKRNTANNTANNSASACTHEIPPPPLLAPSLEVKALQTEEENAEEVVFIIKKSQNIEVDIDQKPDGKTKISITKKSSRG